MKALWIYQSQTIQSQFFLKPRQCESEKPRVTQRQ